MCVVVVRFFFFKQKTAYEMRISDWSSDVCSSDLPEGTVVSALPPDGAVFLYFEQSQVILATALMALEKAMGERAIAGDRAGTNLHTAFGAWPDEIGRASCRDRVCQYV